MSRFTLRRAWLWPALLLAGAVQAQQPPETHPASDHRNIVLTYDRGTLPGDQVLWPERTVMGYSTDPDLKYGLIHLTCGSNSDSGKGRCPVADTLDDSSVPGTIPLRFIERRSGLRTEIELEGWLQRAAASAGCGEYWEPRQRPFWTSFGSPCIGKPPGGTGVALSVPQRELEKLVAGHWDATLELFLRADPDGPVLATYTFTFDLTITDHDAMAIYFPEFDQVSPMVGLNIKYDPIGPPPTIGGRATLDMCLYDGLGSQSEYFEVTLRDDRRSAPGRLPGMYSVWHHSGGTEDRHRLDYEVKMDHNGTLLTLHNDRVEILRGIDTARLRLVLLPGMTQPVYCVPTPLSLITPRVPASTKSEGYYQGQLQVEFTLPTAGP